MIPQIIHQTAKKWDSIPWEEKKLISHLRKILDGWKYCFHDDEDNLNIVKKYFPQYLEQYQSIPKGVAKADIARAMYMFVYGGWYFDTDYKLLQPIEAPFMKGVVLPKSREFEFFRLGNAVWGSEARQQIWIDFLEYIFSSSELSNLQENRIEKVTGPEGFTDFFEKNKNRYSNIKLVEKKFFHPNIRCGGIFPSKGSIGMHLCLGSWRTKSLKLKIKNFLYRKLCCWWF